MRPSRVQQRVLELIEEWRQTICQTSRYKEDLGFIRDMHRLLSFKGYMFPEVRREDAAVLNPSDVGSHPVKKDGELTDLRTSNRQRRWRRKSTLHSQRSSKNSYGGVDLRIYKKQTA